MLHDLYVVFFAMATGFTASGIVGNLYRILVPPREGGFARTAYIGVMVVAGPSALFGSSLKAWRAQTCTPTAFWLAAAVSAYWSMTIGLILLRVIMRL